MKLKCIFFFLLLANVSTAQLDTTIIRNLVRESGGLRLEGKALEAIPVGLRAISIARQIDAPFELGLSYCEYGRTLGLLEKTDSSLWYFNEARAIYESLADTNMIWQTYFSLAGEMMDRNNYQAMVYATKCLEFANHATIDGVPDHYAICWAHATLANIYTNGGKLDLALKHLNESASLDLEKQINEPFLTISNHTLFSEIYGMLGDTAKMLQYSNEAISAAKDMGVGDEIIGQWRQRLTTLTQLGRYEEAISCAENHTIIDESQGMIEGALPYYNSLLICYSELNRPEDFARTEQAALRFTAEYKDLDTELALNRVRYDHYQKNKDFEMCQLLESKGRKLQASVDSMRNLSIAEGAELTHQLITQAHENEVLLVENQLSSALLESRNVQFLAAIIVSILLLGGLLIVIRQRNTKEKLNRDLLAKNIELTLKENHEREQRQALLAEIKAQSQQPIDLPEATDESKYKKSSLKKEIRQALKTKITFLLEDESYFKNSEVSLTGVAAKLEVNAFYITQTINQEMGMNFNEYINQLRIKEARRIIISEEFNHYKLEAIGTLVGFKSKAAFYNAFKKYTGLTPSYYRKQSTPV